VIEIVGRRHDHDRHTPVKTLKRYRELPLADRAGANPPNISKTEYVAQELLDKGDRGSVRRSFACSQIGKERLADAKIARNLVAQRETLRYAVVRLSLCARLMLRDAGQHRGRYQRAFDRDGIEGERGRVAVSVARHIAQTPAGTRT
jgi:hypothetical protein